MAIAVVLVKVQQKLIFVLNWKVRQEFSEFVTPVIFHVSNNFAAVIYGNRQGLVALLGPWKK